MASVALTYMEGLKAMGMVKMHEANQQVMNDLLGLIKQRQRAGVATGLDIARLDAQLASERQQTSVSQYSVERAKLNLLNLLALPYETPLALTDEFRPDVLSPPVVQAAVEEALTQRPEVSAQVTRVRATELTYSSITGERLPSLVAQGDYGLIGNRWDNTLDTYNMALLLQIPIFDGAATRRPDCRIPEPIAPGSAPSPIDLEPCENGSARRNGRPDCRKRPSRHRADRYGRPQRSEG